MPLPRCAKDTATAKELRFQASKAACPKDSRSSWNSLTWPGCTGKVAKRAWRSSPGCLASQSQKWSGAPLSSLALQVCTASSRRTRLSLFPDASASRAGRSTSTAGGASKKARGMPIWPTQSLPRPLFTQSCSAPGHASKGFTSKIWLADWLHRQLPSLGPLNMSRHCLPTLIAFLAMSRVSCEHRASSGPVASSMTAHGFHDRPQLRQPFLPTCARGIMAPCVNTDELLLKHNGGRSAAGGCRAMAKAEKQ
mmetsp:Transcript_97148/g.302463  ORF Transcript_97148/g.302463 Transcript_97148/m.302463 type:complete len:252 (-) Transcript_97148:91-846(-)